MIKINLNSVDDLSEAAILEVAKDLKFIVCEDGIRISVKVGAKNECSLDGADFTVVYHEKYYIFRAMLNLKANIDKGNFYIAEQRKFTDFGIMADCSRNAVLKPIRVKKLIRMLATMGYDSLQLYTEDTYEVTEEPYFGYMRGRYTKAELKDMDMYAQSFGITLTPCIQTLAHVNAIKRWKPYHEIFDADDILLAECDRTYELIEHMFSSIDECFTSREVNIGMDEAHMLGLGKYLDKHGYCKREDIMLRHLKKVCEIAGKYGFKCSMWSDMFFRLAFGGDYYASGNIDKEILKKVPSDLKLIYWDYYSIDKNRYIEMLSKHKAFKNEIVFAGGAWSWLGFAPLNDFSIKALNESLSACVDCGIKQAFITVWGDNGGESSPFKVLPTLLFSVQTAFGIDDLKEIKRMFKALTDIDFDAFRNLDLPNRVGKSDGNDVFNPSRYMLYSDCLLGFMDSTVVKEDAALFGEYALKLKTYIKDSEWGYIFKNLYDLCKVLEIKYDLGIKIYGLYHDGNKIGMKELLENSFISLLKAVDNFYNSLVEYWDTDNKPHGFDVQDLRIGGLLQRLKHCKLKLEDWVKGVTEKVEELEEERLDFYGEGKDITRQSGILNLYNLIATANIL